MKKRKYLSILIICVLLLPFIYKNYLYYIIPKNPSSDLEIIKTVYTNFSQFHPNRYDYIMNNDSDSDEFYMVNEFNYNSDDNSTVIKYINDLKLKPSKLDNPTHDEVNFWYNIDFLGPSKSNPSKQYSLNIKVSLDDLTYIYISCDMPGFDDGYYKIIDGEFDYEYINDIITNSQ